jgi:hypothetical protein
VYIDIYHDDKKDQHGISPQQQVHPIKPPQYSFSYRFIYSYSIYLWYLIRHKYKSSLIVLFILIICTISFSIMLNVSIQQSNSAAKAPQSLSSVSSPDASEGWNSYYFQAPSHFYTTVYNSPDPTLFSDSPLSILISFDSFNPQSTGATVKMILTIYLPYSWYNYATAPPIPYFTTTCVFGDTQIRITPSTSITGQTTTVNYILNSGSFLQFPFDVYNQSTSFYCSYDVATFNKLYNHTITPVNNYINFNVRIAESDVGWFSHTQVYHPAETSTTVIYYSNNITGSYNETVSTYSYPYVEIKFYRAVINQIFPVFIVICMWLIVIGETAVFVPFYLGARVVDGNAIPMAGTYYAS